MKFRPWIHVDLKKPKKGILVEVSTNDKISKMKLGDVHWLTLDNRPQKSPDFWRPVGRSKINH